MKTLPMTLPPTAAIALAAEMLREDRTAERRNELVDLILKCVDAIEREDTDNRSTVSQIDSEGGAA